MKDETSENRFYLTPTHVCSYLPDRQAQTLFLDPRERIDSDKYTELTNLGFRRSGAHLYRPQCGACSACIPTRVPVAGFTPKRSQRRTAKRNEDLEYVLEAASYSPSVFSLYENYIAQRHRDGDMYPANPDQFKTFLLSQWSETYFLKAHLDGRLVAVAVMDKVNEGLSAIYTFFDPELSSRSLGVQMILQEISMCQRVGLPYLYLGYWIRDCDKMSYKTDFRPVELFVNQRWTQVR